MGYRAKPRWTSAQVEFMVQNYRTMKDSEIAYVLGRTIKSVRHKRQRLEMDKETAGQGMFKGMSKPEDKTAGPTGDDLAVG